MDRCTLLSKEVHRAFFARYGGRLRPIQERALELLEVERDGLVVSGTGSGKTEAVFAPIAERLRASAGRSPKDLAVVVVSPTRALASDLHRRMAPVFSELGLRFDVATSDKRTLGKSLPNVLIKTPEGLDSLLCSRPESLKGVQEVVIDEVHVFLNSPRGTQVSGLMARLAELSPGHRRLALSATVPDPRVVEEMGILRAPVLVGIDETDQDLEVIYLEWLGKEEQAADRFLRQLREVGTRRAIGFVSRKSRSEKLAHLLDRGFLRGKCFPHHADLSPAGRRRVEEALREMRVSLVVATTTLEVGIDIGGVDTCILFDAPSDYESFAQRVGRSGRRSGRRRVVCVPGLYDRRVAFSRVVQPPRAQPRGDTRPFLSAVIQQILSYVVQTGSATQERILEWCFCAFGEAGGAGPALLRLLAQDGWIKIEEARVDATEKLLDIARTRALHRTFPVSRGSAVVDEATGMRLGTAAVEGTKEILLGGKGRKIKGVDSATGAILVGPAEGGTASFQSGGATVFDQLALKYIGATGGCFRLAGR